MNGLSKTETSYNKKMRQVRKYEKHKIELLKMKITNKMEIIEH